jgi:hypothetical protein
VCFLVVSFFIGDLQTFKAVGALHEVAAVRAFLFQYALASEEFANGVVYFGGGCVPLVEGLVEDVGGGAGQFVVVELFHDFSDEEVECVVGGFGGVGEEGGVGVGDVLF